ncbi:hypothetical protein [Streptomyces sp. NPDC006739]|uniref:hypothetical protein n=1 Tax=Streptomyces sp. NPDC006739 TaxID=3364763 RepID=UPI00367830C8
MSDNKQSHDITPQESHITGGETVEASTGTGTVSPQESHITGAETLTAGDDKVTTLESHITGGDPR